MHPTKRLDWALVLGLFAAGILLRVLLLLPTHFDGLYGQDAYAYYDFAGELHTALSEGRAPGHFFWPLGYPALLTTTFAIFGASGLTGQAINILMGAALSPLVYGLARLMGFRRFAGFTAGILMLVCGQALQSSLVVMSDIPALFWTTLSAILLWIYIRANEAKSHPYLLAIAAVLLMLAGITRWIYLLLGIPWGVVLLIHWRGRVRWRTTVLTAVGAGLILLPQLLYSRTNPAPTLNHAWVEGWSPANFLSKTFDNIDGHFEYEKLNSVFYAQPFYDVYYLTPLLTPFLLIGLSTLRKQWKPLIMLGGWALLPYLFLGGIPYQNIRFPLIVFPAVALLGGVGLEAVANSLAKTRLKQWAYGTASLLLIYGAAQTLNTASGNINMFITNQQRDKDAAAWASTQIPSGQTLYTFGLTLTLKHYTDLNVYEIYYETPVSLAGKWKIGQDDYLLLNVWNIENQWAGRDPQLDFHWLRDARGLVEMGKFGYYTLYRIEG